MDYKNQFKETDQKFRNKIAFLESKQREQLMPPEDFIRQMPIQNQHRVLDIGAGSGFFTIPMAEATRNTVYAMDPDGRMLSFIEDKAQEKGLTNIELIQAYIEDLSIERGSIDFAMASLILHEVSSLTLALTQINEVLKIGGHLLCLEYEKDDLVIEGPPMAIRIQSEDLVSQLLDTGFNLVKKTKINDAIYTLLAVKIR